MTEERQHHCMFCGKTQHEVKHMVVNDMDAAICNECIKDCVDILFDKIAKS